MPDVDLLFSACLCIWFVVFGACIGSFLNVFIYRLPRRESLLYPPSHCTQCGQAIRWYDNIPVLAWIVLGGKCRDCKTPISIQYPCVEGSCGILFGIIFIITNLYAELSFWPLIAFTLLLSFAGTFVLAVGLMVFGKK